jgi:FkbM family methyltransferase
MRVLRISLLRARKVLFALQSPLGRRALLLGTAASVEHADSFAGDNFATIVDVGANRGQFALFARTAFPRARIWSFEPLSATADRFRRLFSRDPHVTLYPIALGAVSERADLHITSDDDSSSLFAIGDQQSKAFGTREIAIAQIEVERLDKILTENEISRPALLKIDVQGYEGPVLAGCGQLLDCFDVVCVEASFVELYKGQPLVDEIIAILSNAGFCLRGVFNQSINDDGLPLQADLLFRRHLGRGV